MMKLNSFIDDFPNLLVEVAALHIDLNRSNSQSPLSDA